MNGQVSLDKYKFGTFTSLIIMTNKSFTECCAMTNKAKLLNTMKVYATDSDRKAICMSHFLLIVGETKMYKYYLDCPYVAIYIHPAIYMPKEPQSRKNIPPLKEQTLIGGL